MSPRLERELAQDDMAEWAQVNRFAAIACGIPDLRAPTRYIPNTVPAAQANANLIDAFAALPAHRLVDEVRDLQARMLSAQFSVRDFALVTAIIQRLQASPKLVGALWLDELGEKA